jgi:hypothetical protein
MSSDQARSKNAEEIRVLPRRDLLLEELYVAGVWIVRFWEDQERKTLAP